MGFLRGVAFLALAAFVAGAQAAPDDSYASELAAWRKRADDNLRRDLGWLTIAGRWVLQAGDNTLGAAPSNDIVLPKDLAPPRLARLRVAKEGVTLILERNVHMWTEPEPGKHGVEFTQRMLKTSDYGEEWVSSGRLSMTVFTLQNGKSILRIADRESKNRKLFAGRTWYAPNPQLRLPARFVAYAPGTKIPVVNVRGEISEEDAAGYVEFDMAGKKTKLDAFREDDGSLFLILRDQTSGVTTYPPGRFLHADDPIDGVTIVDFNKAYNPPCAFSAYTTCPLPPPQNWIKAPIAAGERYTPPQIH